MAQVIIINPCKADGKHRMPGTDAIDISDEAATALIASGSALAAEPSRPQRPADVADLHAAIRTAIGSMDKDNKELFTAAGIAKVESIVSVLGYAISATERDAALAGA